MYFQLRLHIIYIHDSETHLLYEDLPANDKYIPVVIIYELLIVCDHCFFLYYFSYLCGYFCDGHL